MANVASTARPEHRHQVRLPLISTRGRVQIGSGFDCTRSMTRTLACLWAAYGALDGIEEADELLVPVALHALADHGAVEHVEGREQGGRAVALVVMGHRPERPGYIGRPGWVRWSAWIWLFSSIDSTTAWAGGSTYSPTRSTLAANFGIARELEAAHLVGAQAVRPPDPLHRADAGPAGRSQRRRRPVRPGPSHATSAMRRFQPLEPRMSAFPRFRRLHPEQQTRRPGGR